MCASGELLCQKMTVNVVEEGPTNANPRNWGLRVARVSNTTFMPERPLTSSHCFEPNTTILDHYIVSGTKVEPFLGGQFQLQVVLLQLQSVADLGSLGTFSHVTATSFVQPSAGTDPAPGSVIDALSEPVTPTALPYIPAAEIEVGAHVNISIATNLTWKISFEGTCSCGSTFVEE
eukprot:SAG31_NODE_6207_length_2121_cov_1.450049_2_plen_176_part_00